jgi:hypothetical protein
MFVPEQGLTIWQRLSSADKGDRDGEATCLTSDTKADFDPVMQ